MRGYLDRYEEAQIKSRQYDRGRPIKLKWSGDQLSGQLLIENVLWAYVEWSEKRQEWCIEEQPGALPEACRGLARNRRQQTCCDRAGRANDPRRPPANAIGGSGAPGRGTRAPATAPIRDPAAP